MAGEIGRSRMEREVEVAKGSEICFDSSRHGATPARLLGEEVNVRQ